MYRLLTTALVLGILAVFLRSALAQDTAPPQPDYSEIGNRISGVMAGEVAITEGVIRVRRRHENDMDFGKYNPFYWEGRGARFRLTDHTPGGEKKLVFSLETEWPQDHTRDRGSDLSLIYIGDPLAHETERSKFALNMRMEMDGDGSTRFTKTVDEGAFNAFPEELAPGAVLVFEFRFFNNEEHGPWARQKDHNPHNLSAYYSEFFRVRLGEPGLLIDDPDTPGAAPSPRRYTGGWTTLPTSRVEPWTALQQAATNLRDENAQAFLTGRSWFHTDFQTGEHVGDSNDDKPSVFYPEMAAEKALHAGDAFNTRSCNACHPLNAGAHLPGSDQLDLPIHTTILRLPLDPSRGGQERLGKQIQTDGPGKEAEVRIARYESREVQLDDGTVVELTKPIFAIDGDESLPASPRRPPSLIGMGLLDAVSAEDMEALAEASGGRVHHRYKGSVGRFGWKAEAIDLDYQIREALSEDLGVSRVFQPGTQPDTESLRAYVALLGVPPRDRPEHPDVLEGEEIFGAIGCATCHVPTLRTSPGAKFPELADQTIYPYTDLLLHDMGPGLSDPGTDRNAALWRTAPLWGLKNTRAAARDYRDRFPPGNTEVTYAMTHAAAEENPVQLLHDGRARSLAEAILWHGGEAEESVGQYRKLAAEDRAALEAFLWDL